ncbi:hypothetical protein [Rhizomicrobium electricum]|uniref:hypothetical protein n=1 Tax=Rhizomicrobium electricum TaxID=480070 RepID=UPI0024449C88|nr:hypothetical protein [Rhizomicrobium electricum]
MLAAEREAINAVAGLLRLFPEVRRRTPDRAAYFVMHTVESLTRGYAAHPENQTIAKDDFVVELVTMLEAYLTRADDTGIKP